MVWAQSSLCYEVGCACLQTCGKQYKNAAEMEAHLSSYDHHHKKVSMNAESLTLTIDLADRHTHAATPEWSSNSFLEYAQMYKQPVFKTNVGSAYTSQLLSIS